MIWILAIVFIVALIWWEERERKAWLKNAAIKVERANSGYYDEDDDE